MLLHRGLCSRSSAMAVGFVGALVAAAALSPGLAKGWSFKTLYSFCAAKGCTDGASPWAGVILDKSGNLFGTTNRGGANTRGGTVFKIAPDGTESVLYSFCSAANCTDGEDSLAALIMDKSGNLFGTTQGGGTGPGGTVFELTRAGKETVLYNFCSAAKCTDGSQPEAALITDKSGNLFGTTVAGGAGGASGVGTVFELTRDGTESVLYSFCSAAKCSDGATPFAGLVMDRFGNLFGTTQTGGDSQHGHGTVFEVTHGGKHMVLYIFCSAPGCTDGANPVGSLIIDKSGNLYGTTGAGGANTASTSTGTVFKITPDGTQSVLYNFCSAANCADGANPDAGLIMDKSGNLYGTTFQGGAHNKGTVFELTPDGSESVLYSFCAAAKCTDGEAPHAVLAMDKAGNLFGTTVGGGAHQNGTVFELVHQ
jgi:uncharacterized repeat protein (TIGR03803 family)